MAAKKKKEDEGAETEKVSYTSVLRVSPEAEAFVREYAEAKSIGVGEAGTRLILTARGRLAALRKWQEANPREAKPREPKAPKATKKAAKKGGAKKAAAKKGGSKKGGAPRRTVTEVEEQPSADE